MERNLSQEEIKDDVSIQLCPDEKELPFAMIPHELIRDEKISPQCRLLIIYLLSNVSNWTINRAQLCKHFKGFMGRDAVLKTLKEAIESGYMFREDYYEPNLQIKSKGKIKNCKNLRRCRYLISRTPKFKKFLRRPENKDAELTDTENKGAYKEHSQEDHCKEKQQHEKLKKTKTATPVVVFSCLDKLELTPKEKENLSKKYPEEQLELAIRRVLSWKTRGKDIIAIRHVLKNADKWEDVIPKEEIIEQNKKFLEKNRANQGAKLGKYKCWVGSDYIEFDPGVANQIIRFEVDDKKFIASLCEFIETYKKR